MSTTTDTFAQTISLTGPVISHTYEPVDSGPTFHAGYNFARMWDGVYFATFDISGRWMDDITRTKILPDIWIVVKNKDASDHCADCHTQGDNCMVFNIDWILVDVMCLHCLNCDVLTQKMRNIEVVADWSIGPSLTFRFDKDYLAKNVMRPRAIVQDGHLVQYDTGLTHIGCPVCKNIVMVDRGRKIGTTRFVAGPEKTIYLDDKFMITCPICADTRARILLCFHLPFLPREIRLLIARLMV